MRPDEPNPGSTGHRLPKSGGVEIARRSRAVQVLLSIPAARPVDRRQVIGKARAMLAHEQARLADEKAAATPKPSQHKVQSRPGCGAWWAF